jgi:hypothetical protein
MQVNDKQRYLIITEAAYFLAERRGFAPGHEHEDWLAAERQADEMFKAMTQQPALEQRIESGEKAKPARKAAAPKAKETTLPKARTRGRKKAQSISAGVIPSEAIQQPSSTVNNQSPAPAKSPAKRIQRKKAQVEETMVLPIAAAAHEKSKPATKSRQKKTKATTVAKGDRRRSQTSHAV